MWKNYFLKCTSKNPYEILLKAMQSETVPMHGPIHHILAGSSILAAYKNAGGQIDLSDALDLLFERAKQVPGAACGYWGACGAALSVSQALSVICGTGPVSKDRDWALPMANTAAILSKMSEIGGPRCCKRDCFLSVEMTADYIEKNLGVKLEKSEIKCGFSHLNKQCTGARCPFHV